MRRKMPDFPPSSLSLSFSSLSPSIRERVYNILKMLQARSCIGEKKAK